MPCVVKPVFNQSEDGFGLEGADRSYFGHEREAAAAIADFADTPAG